MDDMNEITDGGDLLAGAVLEDNLEPTSGELLETHWLLPSSVPVRKNQQQKIMDEITLAAFIKATFLKNCLNIEITTSNSEMDQFLDSLVF